MVYRAYSQGCEHGGKIQIRCSRSILVHNLAIFNLDLPTVPVSLSIMLSCHHSTSHTHTERCVANLKCTWCDGIAWWTSLPLQMVVNEVERWKGKIAIQWYISVIRCGEWKRRHWIVASSSSHVISSTSCFSFRNQVLCGPFLLWIEDVKKQHMCCAWQ